MIASPERAERIMGTAVAIEGPEPEHPAVARAMDHLRRVEAMFSTFRPDSQISRINDGTLAIEDADDAVQDVLLRCEVFRDRTQGAFDHHNGDRVDPAGYVKGWAVDGAADILLLAGVHDFMIWAGGDIRTAGRPSGADAWSIGIRDPWDAARVVEAVDLNDGAIATSGRYERGAHIRGTGDDGLASVSVIGPHLTIADALATAVMAVGLGRAGWFTTFPDYQLIAIAEDGRVLRTFDDSGPHPASGHRRTTSTSAG